MRVSMRDVIEEGAKDAPSIRNLLMLSSFNVAVMEFSSNWIVTSIGTIWPSLIYVLMSSPNWLPGRSCSSRSRSPALKCLKP